MKKSLELLQQHKLLPVITIKDLEKAKPLAKALLKGGLPCAEITFRTATAAKAIKIFADSGSFFLGAGTVLKTDQVKEALDNGAAYIVSPGFNPKVVGFCIKNSIPIIPGISTPTDIELALEFGLKVVKFFPAEAFGGLKTLKAISAPYKDLFFVPTGGININNLAEYLNFPKVIACGGSWMVAGNLIDSGSFDEITVLAEEAVKITKGMEI